MIGQHALCGILQIIIKRRQLRGGDNILISLVSVPGYKMTNSSLPDCVVFGGGGHASVAIDCLRLGGRFNPVAVLDDRLPAKTLVEGVPVVGGDSMVEQLLAAGIKYFFCGVGSTGDCAVRRKIYNNAIQLGLAPSSAIHPSAIIASSAQIGDGVFVAAGAVVNAGARIGKNVIINTGAIIDHHCVVGDHAHIASGAVLSGSVAVGTGTHVGAGAVVRHQITIGSHAVVGVGATVVKDVPDNATVFGERARIR